MRDILKLALRLMVFALVSALLLAGVHAFTKERIAANENKKVNASRIAVLGDYDFTEVAADLTGQQYIKHIYEGKDGDAVVGYVYELESLGFGGMVSLSLGIDKSGTVTGISIASHTETKGLGTDQEAPFLSGFIGLSAVGADSAKDVPAETATAAPTATAEAETGATTDSETGASATAAASATAEAETGATTDSETGATAAASATAEAETGATTDAETGATTETELTGAAAGSAVAEVDGMTGATYSTNAVKNAVAEALAHFSANYLGGGAQ